MDTPWLYHNKIYKWLTNVVTDRLLVINEIVVVVVCVYIWSFLNSVSETAYGILNIFGSICLSHSYIRLFSSAFDDNSCRCLFWTLKFLCAISLCVCVHLTYQFFGQQESHIIINGNIIYHIEKWYLRGKKFFLISHNLYPFVIAIL